MFIIDFVDLILMLNSKNHCQDFCQHQKAYLLLCFPLEVLWFPVFCSSVNLFWVDFCVWYNIVIHFHSLYVAVLFFQHHYPSSNIYSWLYHCKLFDYMYIGLFLCSLFCSIDPCVCFYNDVIWFLRASLDAQSVKNLPAMQETWFWFLGQEDPLEEEISIHSSIIAWRIPWTEEPAKLQSRGVTRVRHNLANKTPYDFDYNTFVIWLKIKCDASSFVLFLRIALTIQDFFLVQNNI